MGKGWNGPRYRISGNEPMAFRLKNITEDAEYIKARDAIKLGHFERGMTMNKAHGIFAGYYKYCPYDGVLNQKTIDAYVDAGVIENSSEYTHNQGYVDLFYTAIQYGKKLSRKDKKEYDDFKDTTCRRLYRNNK